MQGWIPFSNFEILKKPILIAICFQDDGPKQEKRNCNFVTFLYSIYRPYLNNRKMHDVGVMLEKLLFLHCNYCISQSNRCMCNNLGNETCSYYLISLWSLLFPNVIYGTFHCHLHLHQPCHGIHN